MTRFWLAFCFCGLQVFSSPTAGPFALHQAQEQDGFGFGEEGNMFSRVF
jgi:hypothetical protein